MKLYFVLIFVLLVSSSYVTRVSGTIEDIINQSREDIERWRIEEDIPAVVIGISIKGKDVWKEAFGYTDLENNVKANVDSVWRMGSVSKSMTTTLVAKLIDEGKLDLNRSINDYLKPEIFPVKTWKGKPVKITLGEVLSHTAGIRQTIIPDDFYHRIYERMNVTQTLAQFKDEPILYEPGTDFKYSNDGFQIIGAIIESVLGETYESAMNKMFAHDLGMSSTFAERHEKIIPHRTRYYVKENDVIENAPLIDDLVSHQMQLPSGGMMSTVPDLLRFGNVWLSSFKSAAHGNDFIKSSTVEKLWTPVKFPFMNLDIAKLYYAHGWIVGNITQPKCVTGNNCINSPLKTVIWHSGSITGFDSSLMLFPDIDLVIVILTNLGKTSNELMSFQIVKNFA